MPLFKLYLGDRGGGKTTRAAQEALELNYRYPKFPVVTNIPMTLPNTVYVNDILKWLAVKTLYCNSKDAEVRKIGMRYCKVIMDEASLQGLESRGSSGKSSVPNTYLIALSRKVNIEFDLISQLMSMIDKRGQWLTDNDILCEAHHLPDEADYLPVMRDGKEIQYFGVPDHFDFTVYKNLRRINRYKISGLHAAEFLFDKFDTNDVPLTEELIQTFIEYYNLYYEDEQMFKESVGMMDAVVTVGLPQQNDFFEWETRKYFRPGERIHVEKEKYGIIKSRIWEEQRGHYLYTLRSD